MEIEGKKVVKMSLLVKVAVWIFVIDILLAGIFLFFQAKEIKSETFVAAPKNGETVAVAQKKIFIPPPHLPLPREVRGIYWTASSAVNKKNELIDYILRHNLNTAVIDIKLDSGEIVFNPADETVKPYVLKEPIINDLDGLLKELYDNKIYRIARIPVMRDGFFGEINPQFSLRGFEEKVWLDSLGLGWVDPAAPEVGDYAIALGHEAYRRGFDEVQFDYVRYPSDGKLKDIVYPITKAETIKYEVMKQFFKKVGGTLRNENIPVSFDLFGITFWSKNDYNIGQRSIDAFPYADFLSPMVYSSHYPKGFEGYKNPADYPYEIIKSTLDKGAELLQFELQVAPEQSRVKFRPWIQDFNIGAVYDEAKIKEQIKAVRDAGASGWLIWNARNVYEQGQYAN